MPAVVKELRYAVEIAADGELTEEHRVRLDVPSEWSPEHLLLAALVRCSLKSLRFHAKRLAITLNAASGAGRTLVTKREADDRYALVDTDVELVVEADPEPEPDALAALLAAAEHDCFVGSSLTAEPTYRWVVNGRAIDP
jgi:uncharacterized OsmC-like protein